jgi:hypothetical protein
MSRIVLVSNRVGDLSKAAQAGGVVVAIADTLRARNGLWLGWSGKIGERSEEQRTTADIVESGSVSVATLPLSSREHKEYYLGYANDVLWPVFHSRLDLAQFEAGYYQRYLGVNRRFARTLHPLLKPDDTMAHDHHMILMGMELRKLGVENPIGSSCISRSRRGKPSSRSPSTASLARARLLRLRPVDEGRCRQHRLSAGRRLRTHPAGRAYQAFRPRADDRRLSGHK